MAASTTHKSRMTQVRLARRVTGVMMSDACSIVSATHTIKSSMHRIQLENTYKMEPDEEQKFSSPKVKEVIYNVLESYLADCNYEPEKCNRLCQDLSSLIKSRVREMDFERYKIICSLSIGEISCQGMEMSSRFLWNTNTDNFATATYKNKDIFAIATVYGIYLE